MRDPRLGWLGVGLVVVGLAVIVLAPRAGGVPGLAPGGMMGSGGMMNWGPAPSAPAGTSVRMARSRFMPATLTIAPGSTVSWFNDDSLPHTVTAVDGSWDSGNLAPGDRFERRFDAAGTFAYLCRYHPGMTGTITVATP